MRRTKTQADMYYDAQRRSAELNSAMLDALFGVSPITDDELRVLIAIRPHVYGRFAGYLGARPGSGAIYWGA